MMPATEHLLVAPVLLPLGTAALMLMLGEGRRRTKAAINTASTALGLALAIWLLMRVQAGGPTVFGVYLPGNWPVPFGIVLVADPLAAFMAVLAGAVGLAALLYALARWQHAGVYFHVLFQLQLMGLSGAFLTFAIVIGEFTMAALLNKPAFGPFMQLLGANRAYEPAALAVIAFGITWGCLGLIQLVSRLQKTAPRQA